MTSHRHFQSALLTAALLVAGVACSNTATTSPTDDSVANTSPAPAGFAVADTTPPTVADPATSSTPDPAPEPTPDPQPDPDPAPEPEPDPDPTPTPGLDLGLTLGTVPPLFNPVIVANLPACGLYLPIPDDAAAVNSLVVDAFGDGTANDTVTSYLDVGAGEWRVRLVPSAGGISEVTVTGVGPGFVEVLGAVHVDTDDAEQILAIVGSGASAYVLGVFGADADGCLFQFTWNGSNEPVTFAVGATVGHMSGLQCYESDGWRYLSSMSAVSNGPGTGTWNIYGSDATRESEQTLMAGDGIHVFGVADGDPQLATVPTIACPGITL